jgi:voltage-dependent potassium channel beta subunit
MQHRRVGKWGVQVSAIGLGSWLTYGGTVAERQAAECITYAYENGVTFFDTANVYARGRSEEVVGEALQRYERDSFVLATKVYFPMGDRPNDSGLSRKHIFEQAHHSLRRLQTDYIDLYQCHRFDSDTPLEETCRAMDDLIRQGKVLYWGTSEWQPDQLTTAVELCIKNGWAPPISDQPQYNALYRRIESGNLATTHALGMGNVVWSPLAMGALSGKYAPGQPIPAGSRADSEGRSFMEGYLADDVLRAVQDAASIAADAGITLPQLALAWCLRQENVSSVIVGASRPEQLHDTSRAGSLTVPRDVLDAYDELLAPVALAAQQR